jgi:NADPH2:quinone reductase
MLAVRCLRYGPPEQLELAEVPDPVPGPGEVVVDVGAAAVNFTDLLFIADRYQVRVPLPFTPGSEFAGTVSAVGDDVPQRRVGDRVAGQVMTGAFAGKVRVAADDVAPVPSGADLCSAAATGVAFRTAYSALRSAGELTPGEWLGVTGAAGGVGSAAVLLGRAMGARVMAIVSTPEKARFCTHLGADAVVDLSAEPDVRAAIRRPGGGLDVALDLVGGPLAEVVLRGIRRRGRFVTAGYASGVIPAIPLNLVLLKDVQVRGFELRGYLEHEPERARRDASELAELLGRGLAAPVSATYPLARAAEAMRTLADRRALGKVVLIMRPHEIAAPAEPRERRADA